MTQTSLRVQNSPVLTPRKSSEAEFERKIALLLKEAGCHSYHTSEKAFQGIPDRYVCGGRWIEFKQAAVVNFITPMRLLSRSQKDKLSKFSENGDECYVCILFQFSNESWCVLMEWETFKGVEGRWDRNYIASVGYQEKDWEEMLRLEGFDA